MATVKSDGLKDHCSRVRQDGVEVWRMRKGWQEGEMEKREREREGEEQVGVRLTKMMLFRH